MPFREGQHLIFVQSVREESCGSRAVLEAVVPQDVTEVFWDFLGGEKQAVDVDAAGSDTEPQRTRGIALSSGSCGL
jgi:hypothetical protein